MRFILVSLLITWSFLASAQLKPNFEIPVSREDWSPADQPRISHQLYRVKLFKCQDEDYGILYKSYWGWSQGSQFIGVCKWENRFSIDTCEADSEPGTVECYKIVVEQFKINQNIKN